MSDRVNRKSPIQRHRRYGRRTRSDLRLIEQQIARALFATVNDNRLLLNDVSGQIFRSQSHGEGAVVVACVTPRPSAEIDRCFLVSVCSIVAHEVELASIHTPIHLIGTERKTRKQRFESYG